MRSMIGKRVLLIGGAGFIGHHLALALNEAGANVSVVDSLQVNNLLSFMGGGNDTIHSTMYTKMISQRLDLLRENQIPLFVQDARDYHALFRVVDQVRPEIVIHLAAVAHANRSNKDPYSTFDHSLRTLENALDASRANVEHFIYFSSSMVYGNFKEDFVTEESICEPLGIYGALKFAGEKMVIAYNQVFDLPYTIVRPSALYGERCVSRRVGQIFIENALRGLTVTVDGDGSDRLDFTYIGDLVNGIKRVIESPNSINQTFNITYGGSRSIFEVAGILKEHFPKIDLEFHPRDKLTPSRGTLSVDKAKNLIGYQPQYSIERGFVDYIKWYRQLFSDETMARVMGSDFQPAKGSAKIVDVTL